MPTWKRKNPDHQPLKCNAANHLWTHGLALAIYQKAGELTVGGDVDRAFFVKRTTLAKFFDASYNATCNAMKYLLKEKWLVATDKENHFRYISHEQYVIAHPGRCVTRDLLPFQEDTDPFVGKLFALSQGHLKLKGEFIINNLRKLAGGDEELILDLFRQQRAKDIARRKAGDAIGTSPANSLYAVTVLLKQRAEKRA